MLTHKQWFINIFPSQCAYLSSVPQRRDFAASLQSLVRLMFKHSHLILFKHSWAELVALLCLVSKSNSSLRQSWNQDEDRKIKAVKITGQRSQSRCAYCKLFMNLFLKSNLLIKKLVVLFDSLSCFCSSMGTHYLLTSVSPCDALCNEPEPQIVKGSVSGAQRGGCWS